VLGIIKRIAKRAAHLYFLPDSVPATVSARLGLGPGEEGEEERDNI
jgi:hypothetical protein